MKIDNTLLSCLDGDIESVHERLRAAGLLSRDGESNPGKVWRITKELDERRTERSEEFVSRAEELAEALLASELLSARVRRRCLGRNALGDLLYGDPSATFERLSKLGLLTADATRWRAKTIEMISRAEADYLEYCAQGNRQALRLPRRAAIADVLLREGVLTGAARARSRLPWMPPLRASLLLVSTLLWIGALVAAGVWLVEHDALLWTIVGLAFASFVGLFVWMVLSGKSSPGTSITGDRGLWEDPIGEEPDYE